jgi:hypothetical protein
MKLIRNGEIFRTVKDNMRINEIRNNEFGCIVDENNKTVYIANGVWAKVRKLGFDVIYE